MARYPATHSRHQLVARGCRGHDACYAAAVPKSRRDICQLNLVTNKFLTITITIKVVYCVDRSGRATTHLGADAACAVQTDGRTVWSVWT
jgi:hypothetical protein